MGTEEIKIYYTVLTLCLFLGLIIGFYLFSFIYHTRRMRKLLMNSIRQDVKLLEQERNRIAQDLHDGIGSMLALAKLEVDLFHNTKEDKDAQKAKTTITSVALQLNDIANSITPRTLKTKGLKTTINDFIKQFEKTTSTKIIFNYEGAEPTELISLHIYRIIQEVIGNTIKHSGADILNIIIKEKNKQLYIHTKDDGKGFNMPSMLGSFKGMGLWSIQSRCLLLGGTMTCESDATGTTYLFILPLKDKNE